MHESRGKAAVFGKNVALPNVVLGRDALQKVTHADEAVT